MGIRALYAVRLLYSDMSDSYSYPPCNICVCVCVCVCVRERERERVMASMSLRGGEDTSCVRLGTGSGRKTEENVFLQRDCIQSLKTVI